MGNFNFSSILAALSTMFSSIRPASAASIDVTPVMAGPVIVATPTTITTTPAAPTVASTARSSAGRWAAVAVIAVPLVAGFEGYAAKPYVDRVGTGHPVTWCYGQTKSDGPVPPFNKVFTKAECMTLLGKSLEKYDIELRKCIPTALDGHPHREAALVSFSYNLGTGTTCHLAHYFNSGNYKAGCNAMDAYIHANGVVLKGLVTRRERENELCLMNN